MSLVPSLLQAIVSVDGEALVMHASERPYVVSPSGQVELSSAGLTLEAVTGIVAQLLPAEVQQTLEEFGAVQYTLPPQTDFPREQFTVIAARGGGDVWAEVRRRRMPDDDHAPEAFFVPPQVGPAERAIDAAFAPGGVTPGTFVEDAEHRLSMATTRAEPPAAVPAVETRTDVQGDGDRDAEAGEDHSRGVTGIPEPPASAGPISSGVVLTMSRPVVRAEPGGSAAADDRVGLERLLRVAASRGASTLYLASDSRPSIRVDGRLQVLDKESLLPPSDVLALLVGLKSGPGHDTPSAHAATECVCDVEALGRVRCLTFSDQRGPGAIFRFVPPAQSAEQLGLSREIQELASASDGLILVAGSRSSGKRTLMSALVDLVNRDRCDHVISIEREVGILHANIKSFISQREVPGDEDALIVAARAALREDPDVLVLDEIRARRSMDIAFDAAAAGRLVIAGVSARHTAHAIERIVDFYPVEAASQMRLALAERLRGVVAQVLLPRTGGGRVAAREVLLNTSAVAGAIAEGKTSSLSSAIEGGRRHGMVSLQDALMALVQSQMVDARDACRHISDVPAFLDALERHGIDTSAVERTA